MSQSCGLAELAGQEDPYAQVITRNKSRSQVQWFLTVEDLVEEPGEEVEDDPCKELHNIKG